MRNPPASRGEAEDGTTGDVNGEETAEKVGPRKRVTQACDQCRVRKEKCDNVKPVCKNCTTQETTCTYEPRTKKRGVPGGKIIANWNKIQCGELLTSGLFQVTCE
jgi:hypothetical protein